jgi:hypothetical protein
MLVRQCELEKQGAGGVTKMIAWIQDRTSAIGTTDGEWTVVNRWQTMDERLLRSNRDARMDLRSIEPTGD